MARSYAIAQILQSGGPGSPARIRLAPAAGNVAVSFDGKFYRNSAGLTQPGYTAVPSPGYTLVAATTFDIIDNPSYEGRYTVYSPVSAADASANPPSTWTGTDVEIRVSEVVGPPTTPGNDVNTGSVTNISTYLIAIAGESPLVIPPTVNFTDRPLELVGRFGSPWGESFSQNFIELAQNFASGSAPANPYLGQTWYDSTLNVLNLRTASGWTAIASGVAGSNVTYRHTQGAASTTWTINHNLGLVAPYICLIQIFVDVGAGVHKMMMPSDITFTNANSLTVSFTSAQDGIAIIHA